MIDYNKLKNWFCSTDKIFSDFGLLGVVLDSKIKTKRRIFIDRQSDILFVAHADTILKPKLISQGKKVITATGLDDRLGCYTAYTLSKKLKCDLLITDLEEKGISTAQHHICKEYNWIVEFDRAGSDIVTYDLDNTEFRQALSKYWKCSDGLFSDISSLGTDSCCMNLGIGYELPHSKTSYASKKIYHKQVELFKLFFAEFANTNFGERDEIPKKWYDVDYKYDENCGYAICDFCGMGMGDEIHGYFICPDCFEARLVYDSDKIPF